MSGDRVRVGWLWLVGAVTLLVLAGVVLSPSVDAVAGTVVINELHYHPVNDPDGSNSIDDNEFIELHNPGTSAVNLAGYTVSDGVSSFAPLSGSLAPGAYVVLGPEGGNTVARWGVTPIGTYTGKLGNGGEKIELLDSAGTVVDVVDYDDASPWPGAADGNGPSLELIDALSDNSLAASWGPSLSLMPTPGVVNSLTVTPGLGPITNVVNVPASPSAGQATAVFANVPGGGALPKLYYRVGFAGESVLTMRDNGAAPDVTAGDGVFSVSVPGQGAGELVRYRIVAPATGEEAPAVGDGRNYLGYVVDDGVSTGMPLFEWFIPNSDYNSMFNDPTQNVTVSGSVLVVDGVVYDNVETNIRGGSYARNNHDKQGISFEMPSGIDLNRADMVPYPIDEFALIAERGWTFGRPFTSWQLYEEAGFPTVNAQHVRVQKNGQFYGVFRFSEKLDGTWRDENDIDGEFFKAVPSAFGNPATGFEKKQPNDGNQQPVIDFAAQINASPSSAKTDYLYDAVDLPNLVNMVATSTVVGHFDSKVQNYYVHQDTSRTGLWQVYPWDLSNTFGVNGPGCVGNELNLDCVNSPLWDAASDVPEIDEMVWRRIRTLLDGPVSSGVLQSNFAAYAGLTSSAEKAADDAAWSSVGSYKTPSSLNSDIAQRLNGLLSQSSLPSGQSSLPGIVVNEVHYNPVAGVEFVELFNPLSEAVDLSGWELDGVGLEFPGGTVILPGEFVVATEDIPAFQAAYPSFPNTVLVQFDGGASNGGELIELLDASGNVIDSVSYDDAAPWPTNPDGGGTSLELVSPGLDNSLAGSWGQSTDSEGSPGEVNNAVVAPDVTDPVGVIGSPVDGSSMSGAVAAVSGSVSDTESGVAQVRVAVKRTDVSPVQYWNGTAWVTAFTSHVVSSTGGAWSLPGIDFTVAGSYEALVWVKDVAGNIASYNENLPAAFTVTSGGGGPDVTDPVGVVGSPVDGSSMSGAVVAVSGSASDTESGVAQVRVAVRRTDVSPVQYWDGTAWGTAFASHVVSSSAGAWSLSGVDFTVAGSYEALVRVTDVAGNIAKYHENPRSSFTVTASGVDVTDPSGVVLSPADGGSVASGVVSVSGSASDTESGVDVVRVVVRRGPSSAREYWDGTVWVSSWSSHLVSSSGGAWSLSGVNLDSVGDYQVLVWVRDNAGNVAKYGENPGSSFSVTASGVDVTDPVGVVGSPVDGSSLVSGVVSVSGSASDTQSGVDVVRVVVRRGPSSAREYWDGTVWVSSWSSHLVSSSGGAWSLSGVNLDSVGDYQVLVWVRDNAGNVAKYGENPGSSFSVTASGVDVTDPVGVVGSPVDGSSMSGAVVSVSGSASDTQSGVAQVRVLVQRIGVSPNEYWDGTAWVTSFTSHTVSSLGGAWSLPGVNFVTPGNYKLRIWVQDNAGNTSTYTENPTVNITIN